MGREKGETREEEGLWLWVLRGYCRLRSEGLLQQGRLVLTFCLSEFIEHHTYNCFYFIYLTTLGKRFYLITNPYKTSASVGPRPGRLPYMQISESLRRGRDQWAWICFIHPTASEKGGQVCGTETYPRQTSHFIVEAFCSDISERGSYLLKKYSYANVVTHNG